MARSRFRRWVGPLALLLACATQACANVSATAPARVTGACESTPRDACPPVRILVCVDKTGSAPFTLTPSLSTGEVEELLRVVRGRGGELAIGVINARSNVPLRRLLLAPPPLEPLAPQPEGNPFLAARANARHRKCLALFEGERRSFMEMTNARIQAFTAEIGSFLVSKPNAPATDVFGALERADLFFGEPASGSTPGTRDYFVLVTDGQDNVRKPYRMSTSPRILLVNGTGSVGALSALKPLRFENSASAIRWLAASEMTAPGL